MRLTNAQHFRWLMTGRLPKPVTAETAPPAAARLGKARTSGIVCAAAALGVTRLHLWAVLTGRRQSRSLLARYHALKGDGR